MPKATVQSHRFWCTVNPNLGGGVILLPPHWFSVNNSETVEAASLIFFSIQLHLLKDVHTKLGIRYSPQSPDIGQNSDGGISDFWISGQSLLKRICHNS